MINVRVLENRIKLGLVEGKKLENTKTILERINSRDTKVDAWDVINNDGTFGTEIVVTKEGHIDLYLCIKKRWSSYISYVRVGNFQPEFGLGDVYLMNGKEVEYKKLGNIINALNKEYEKYGFYFDTTKNRSILASARKEYKLDQSEIKMRKQEEKEVERLQNALVEKTEELLGKKVTIDIDGEGKVEEIKDATYEDANRNYKKRRKQAPEKGNGYNKTTVVVKIDGKIFHEMSMCLQSDTDCYELKDALLAQLKALRKTWVEGDGVPYFSPEKNQEVIKEKYGSKERLAIVLDAKELVVNNLGVETEPTPDPEPEKKSGFEVRVVNISTGETVQAMDAPNMRMAEKIERGVLINLNTDDYYVEIVDLAQSKDIKDATPEEVLEIAEELGLPSLDEEVSPEPTPEDVIEWQGLEKNKTYTNKSEEKEMNTINKNALNNRMVKLGEFLKENTDKQEIENKVFELFPKAMEVEVFNNDNVVYFLVGQDYVGKAPTKKEMKEKDYLFDIIDELYGLSVHVSVNDDKIEMCATIGVDYRDKYNNTLYTDCTVKEIEIELELTMEKAERKAEHIREMHTNEKISATYAWERIRELSLKETTDEVLDFLIEELTYYAYEEKKEKEKNNVEHIQYTINKAHYLFAEGTVSVERILKKLKRLYEHCHNDKLKQQVDETVALYEKAEDFMWRETVRKQVTELVEERQKAMVQRNIDKLEKAVTGRVSYEDARKILDEFAIYIKREWKEDTKGYRVVTEPMRSKCFGVGNEKNITGGCEKIICTRGLQYGIEWKEDTDTMVIFVEGKLEYIKDGEVVTDEKHCIFKKEINCNPEPEKNELDSIEESEVVTEKPEQTRLDDTSQPKKRKYATIEQYDYVNKEEFEKHRKEMEDAGFRLINGIYGGLMDAGELGGSETWTYTASYIKSDMY